MAGRFDIIEDAPPEEGQTQKAAPPGGRFEIIPETLPPVEIGHVDNRIDAEAKKLEEIPAALRYPMLGVAGAVKAIPGSTDARAALAAGLTYLGATPPDVKTTGPFSERFASAKRKQEDFDNAAARSYPVSTYGGQIAGALGLPLARAAGRVASVVEPLVGAGVGSVAGLGTVGALYGGASGLGEGYSLNERISNAERGAIIGGVGGVAIPSAVAAVGAVGSKLADFLALRSPASEASSKLASGMQSARIFGGGMSPAEADAGLVAGQPVLPIDLGGAAIRQAAKTASHASPEAKGILLEALQKRAAEQQGRVYDFLSGLVGKRLDDPNVVQSIQTAAKSVNTPAYRTAMTKGASGVWNNTLDRISNHPWIKQAIPQAIEEANANAIAEGLPPIKNPFVVDKAGNLTLRLDANGQPMRPSLEFWDIVKKNIDGRMRAAEATPTSRGDPNTVRIGKSIVGALTKELDKAVPEYAAARAGAGRYLGEENAYRFGSKFLSSKKAADINAGIARIRTFTPEELEYAQHSYMAERAQKFMNAPKNRDVGKMMSDPAQKAKDVAILGQQKADQLEAYLLRESMMQRSLSSLGGSDSVPNAIAAFEHLAGRPGSGFLTGAGAGAAEAAWEGSGKKDGLDPVSFAKRVFIGAMVGGLTGRRLAKSRASAVELADRLVSEDPAVWQEALQQIARTPRWLLALRRAEAALPAVASSVRELPPASEPLALPPPVGDRQRRATGGRATSRKATAQSLIAAVERAKKSIQSQTEAILAQPDEHVVKALAVANEKI